MKIFTFEWGETDWVYAPNMEEAKAFYIEMTSCGDLDGCNIYEVPKDEWGSLYILNINESEPDPQGEIEYNEDDYLHGYKIEMTFKEYAEKNTDTNLIATTAF